MQVRLHIRNVYYVPDNELFQSLMARLARSHHDCDLRFDYVDVRDGPSSASPSLGRFCHNGANSITSSGSEVTIKFRQDRCSLCTSNSNEEKIHFLQL